METSLRQHELVSMASGRTLRHRISVLNIHRSLLLIVSVRGRAALRQAELRSPGHHVR